MVGRGFSTAVDQVPLIPEITRLKPTGIFPIILPSFDSATLAKVHHRPTTLLISLLKALQTLQTLQTLVPFS